MKAEQARKLTDEALESLSKALDSGASDGLTAYLSAMAQFHRYSFGNILLIMTQRPDATHVAGFQTWKSLGRFVNKGEKGIVIVAPMSIRKKDADEADSKPMLRFRAVHVFDISQTDGDALPEPARVNGNPSGYTDSLKQFIAGSDIVLTYADHLNGADGVSRGGSITVLNTLPPAEEFAVLVHELAHELLHKNRSDNRPSKTVRETEAEAVAYVVSHSIGLDTNTASSDYISLYQGDTTTLAASLDRIQKAATCILEALSNSEPH